ncbi:Inner membrane protein YibH [Pseudomonas fluorescens]|nr:Inner membrane protein YibH [Pseudomonas fluorescens]
MTPDQRFTRHVRFAILLLTALFIYFLAADLYMPLTPQAQLTRSVVRIAPRVSGQVIEVTVANNQHVEAGQLLFRLDPRPFVLKVKEAQLMIERARQDYSERDANLGAAQADLSAAKAKVQELSAQAARIRTLHDRNFVSTQLRDQINASLTIAQSQVRAASSTIEEIRARRGGPGDGNVHIRQAQNALEQARLQLDYSEVRAERAGVVGNLQLSPGAYLQAGASVMALVEDNADVTADFREKALRYAQPGTTASVVFDARPGEIFAAKVSHLESGVKEGQIDANGDLAAPLQSDRWVRDAQRQRIHLVFDSDLPPTLPSGAKATVQLFSSNNAVARLMGALQIRLVSIIHYVY